MREIGGDAALYFNTMDDIELAVLIRFVMEKPELRGFLIENGLRRAELFSFERCVQQTLRVVDEVCRRSLAAK
jgi:glycosyltransferase involved in cell wall biosynthesis